MCTATGFLSKREDSMGVNANAQKREEAKTIMIISASSLNIIPVMPGTKITGMNIAIVVAVEAVTARPTSEEPNIADSFGASPISRR